MGRPRKNVTSLTRDFVGSMPESPHHSEFWFDTDTPFFCVKHFNGKKTTWLKTSFQQRNAYAHQLGKRLTLYKKIGTATDLDAERQIAIEEHDKLEKMVAQMMSGSLVATGRKVSKRFVAAMVESRPMVDNPNYDSLLSVLMDAYEQATTGKGAERHAAGGLDFEDQDLLMITREVGLGFPAGQAIKKVAEGLRLPKSKARHEFLGAIVYLAGAIVYMDSE